METGKPVILVLIQGRPRILAPVADVDAILFAGYPGCMGGEAIASVLSGSVNPSGRLSFSYPASSGHFIPYYHKYSDSYSPHFAFGHGLSYTDFTYSNLIVGDSIFDGTRPVHIQVSVKNKGERAGAETVLLYKRDEVGRITRPVKELVDFRKVYLEPGESRTLTFELAASQLSYPDHNGNPVLEDGRFRLSCGPLSCGLHLKQR